MRVSLIASGLDLQKTGCHLTTQVRFFQRRGDEVSVQLSESSASLPAELASITLASSDPLPPADLYIYHYSGEHALLADLRQRDQGTILVHDHGSSPDGWLPAHYADLCCVTDATRRLALIGCYGMEAERVHQLPPCSAEPEMRAAYDAVFGRVVDMATNDSWSLGVHEPQASTPAASTSISPGTAAPRAQANLARTQADVMARGYIVHSRVPFLGGLITRVRRNLTSHLREPYLDPTLERQVAFNQTMLVWMEQVLERLEVLECEIQRLQEQDPDPDDVYETS